jgi:hypothetical protein
MPDDDDGQEVSRRGGAYLNTVSRVKKEGTLQILGGLLLDGGKCQTMAAARAS